MTCFSTAPIDGREESEFAAGPGADAMHVWRRALVLLALGAVVVRLVYVATVMRGYAPVSDAHHYLTLADAVASGQGFVHTFPFGFTHPTAFRPPLYPGLLGLVFAVSGTHVGVAQGLGIAFGAGSVVLAASMGRELAGSRAGIAAGIVAACYPPLLAADTTVLTESLSTLLLLSCLLLVVRGRVGWAGLTAGLLVLSRTSAPVVVIALAGVVGWRLASRRAIRFAAIAALVVTPWVARNWVRMGSPVLTTSSGFNLFATYPPEPLARGGFVDVYNDSRFQELRHLRFDEVAFDAELRDRALQSLRAEPGQVVSVADRNLRVWLEVRATTADTLDGRDPTVQKWTRPLLYAVSIAGLVGLWSTRRRLATQLLATAAGSLTLVSLVSVAVPRLRVPVDVCLAVGAGVVAAPLLRLRPRPADGVPADAAARLGRHGGPPSRRDVGRVARATAVLIALIAMAQVWHLVNEHRVRDDVRQALDSSGSTVATLAQGYPLHTPVELPAAAALNQATEIERELFIAAPQVSGPLQGRIRAAARALGEADFETRALVLVLLDVQRHTPDGTVDLDALQTRYEEVQDADRRLPPWDDVVTGAVARRASDALDALERSLR